MSKWPTLTLRVGVIRRHPLAARMRHRRVAILAALTILISGLLPTAARGYEVEACVGDAGNQSWLEQRTAPSTHLRALSSCSPVAADPQSRIDRGLGVVDELWGSEQPPGGELQGDGRFAEVSFTAASGTIITAAVIERDLGARTRGWHQYGRVDNDYLPGETCDPGPFEAYCRVSGPMTVADLSAESIAYGIRCAEAPECPVGASLHEAWSLVRGARVTLDDLEAPVVGAIEADGLADGGWHNGAGELVFTASDNTGVQERRIVEGSVVRAIDLAPASAAGGCRDGTGVAFTYVDPCAGTRGVNGRRSLTVNPCGWGAGSHTIKAVAFDVDRAKTESAPVTVKVDCSVPQVAVSLADATPVAGTGLTPSISATDSASGVASTTVEVSVDGGMWQRSSGPVTVEAGRSYRFRARAVDVAGNTSAWSSSTTVLGVAPAEPVREPEPGDEPKTDPVPGPVRQDPTPIQTPAPPLTPASALPALSPAAGPAEVPTVLPTKPSAGVAVAKVRTRGRRVTLSGTVARTYRGKVVVTLVLGVRTRPLTRRVAPRQGRWSVRLALPRKSARPRSATAATRATASHAASAAHLRLG